ncbi:MAG: carbohydrate ABC transporter permease [Chloroflexi bacterium]|nr:carbohydrate ABC transporter permease [Chloroflexota bacterium]MCC6893865.1 carbohydrate ABC transporter permease [Anaerolineae bacterium]
MTNLERTIPVAEPSRNIASPFHWARRIPVYILILLFCITTAFPIYWMIVSVFQPVKLSLQYPPPLFPQSISFNVFEEIFSGKDTAQRIDIWIVNSIILACLTTLFSLGLSILGAYALSGRKWRGQGLFGLMLLMTQMLPEALIVIPLYATIDKLHMKDSLLTLALVDTAFVLPICIWILKNVFDTIPNEIRDAALVDGCTRMKMLWRIMLPIAAPGLVAVGVVAFFHAWNEYLFAASIIGDRKLYTAAVGLGSMISMIDTPIDKLMAGGLMFSIFPVIFYLLVQRYIVAGLSAGAVKG